MRQWQLEIMEELKDSVGFILFAWRMVISSVIIMIPIIAIIYVIIKFLKG